MWIVPLRVNNRNISYLDIEQVTKNSSVKPLQDTINKCNKWEQGFRKPCEKLQRILIIACLGKLWKKEQKWNQKV